MLGSAYFNAGQYDKAVQAFRAHQQKYPQSKQANEVSFSLAQASYALKDYVGASAQYEKLAGVPQFRDRALFYGAYPLKEGGRMDDAIKNLEKLTSPDLRDAQGVKAAMLLMAFYGEKNEDDKRMNMFNRLLQKSDLIDDLGRLNAMSIEMGDDHLQSERPAEALSAYQLVRSRDEIIGFQESRVAKLEKQLERLNAAMRINSYEAASNMGRAQELKESFAEAKRLAEESKNLTDFTPAVNLRIGRAFYETGHKWESIVAYKNILDRYPEAPEREAAMFGMLVDYSELNQTARARTIGTEYLQKFPQGANADTAAYLVGATALQANDPESAETFFGRMLEERPGSSFKEEMLFLLGNARFALGKFEEVLKDYEKYKAEFPHGRHVEEVDYRIAVALVFSGKYEAAIPVLEKYFQAYPNGEFVPDAKYRLAICYYAACQYDDVIQRCRDWEKQFGNNTQLGEVLALQGDAEGAKGDLDASLNSHIRSWKIATTDEVIQHSLFEAQKSLQKKGDWARMSAMFQEFVSGRPNHPIVPMAVFWIAKAKAREGKVDEAKQFIADTVKKHIDDPKHEAVEQLLQQLAQLCSKKKRPAPPAPGAPAEAAATPEPPADPNVEIDALIGNAGEKSQTASARVIYLKAEVAMLRKKKDEHDEVLGKISRAVDPKDLSPMLLALVGDLNLEKGDTDNAAKFFQKLMTDYPKSEVVEFAYNGLGQIALAKGENDKALKLFTQAIEQIGASRKLRDLTVGQAKSLLALGRLDESKKVFEQVASIREWRGEATALAVYSLGDIEFRRGKIPEANAYFQRVFVGYQKFLPWVARAYLKSGECFEKLGKKEEAVRTYQEMLRNEKLAPFEETSAARKRLQELGGGAAS
jgi:TolA-binding protein